MNRDFGEKLTIWYVQNKRHLLWRDIHNPYKIWLSEIILRQTRVNQGLSYYHWPYVLSLVEASVHHRGVFDRLPATIHSFKNFVLFYFGFFKDPFKQ